VAAVLEHDAAQRGGTAQPCLVVGHSLGSAVALRTAIDSPSRVAALALLAPSPRVGAAAAAAWRGKAAAAAAAGDARLAAATRAVSHGYDFRPALPTLRMPTLLLVGANDTMTPPRGAAALAQALPHATLAIIPGAGHDALTEAPEAVRALQRWAEDVAAPAVAAAVAAQGSVAPRSRL
jgi:pimeloyl-ACP methyl ester carboxylesterase